MDHSVHSHEENETENETVIGQKQVVTATELRQNKTTCYSKDDVLAVAVLAVQRPSTSTVVAAAVVTQMC